MHKLIFGSMGEKIDVVARSDRQPSPPLQFLAAGSLLTGVDGPASAQSTSASSSPTPAQPHRLDL